MAGQPSVAVLRLGHRPGRDNRMTTHVGLTARALGAETVYIHGSAAQAKETIDEVTARFGGPFTVELVDEYRPLIQKWPGSIVHLTMYGLPVQKVIPEIQAELETDPILIIVGAEKVPFDVYEQASYNIGVSNQPHSEVASLAVFLDRLFAGNELDRTWENATHEIVPKARGKDVREVVDE